MTGRRPERLAEQIKEEVSVIISGELNDPRVGFVTVTEAKVSPDLKHAKIFVSVIGEDQHIAESMKALNHASGFIRHRLGSVMRIKHAPELRFIHDDTERTAARIEELLSEEVQKAKDDEDVPSDKTE
ncbi:MAG TPA: 30S ribosome-binding factor RbfA [Blastocatellia bacterium]|jgi:ribosome-binding factor A